MKLEKWCEINKKKKEREENQHQMIIPFFPWGFMKMGFFTYYFDHFILTSHIRLVKNFNDLGRAQYIK